MSPFPQNYLGSPGVGCPDQRLGRSSQVAWGALTVRPTSYSGALWANSVVTVTSQRRSAGWVFSPGLVPLPGHTFEGLDCPVRCQLAAGVPTLCPTLGRHRVGLRMKGSSCSAYQTTSRVQQRWAGSTGGSRNGVTAARQAVPGWAMKRPDCGATVRLPSASGIS